MIVQQKISSASLPRVLILGQTFTNDTGGGITLGNLFKNWPKNKVAVAIESKEDVDFSRSDNYYRIGYNELKMPFPFYLFQRKTKSGALTISRNSGARTVAETKGLKYKLKNLFDRALHFFGLFFWMYGNENVNEELFKWIQNFQPEIIYYQPNSYKSIEFVLAIKQKFGLPLVSHVMDDWFSFSVRSGPLYSYWQNKLTEKVERLFKATDLHLSICDFMSTAYKLRYGYDFLAFHNSVNLDFWSTRVTKRNEDRTIKMLYAGRIGYGLEDILVKIADAVEELGSHGIAINFEIQTKDQKHHLVEKFNGYSYVTTSRPIPYIQLPQKFSSANILLIPSDFDGPGLKFIKYSMPTKVSEYMATGVAILVVAPNDTALTDYAKEGWAMVCSQNTMPAIQESIMTLLTSEKIRVDITQNANRLVLKNHDETVVNERFRSALVNLTRLFNNKSS